MLGAEKTKQGMQIILPGAERSARQAAAAREAEGHGRLRAKKAQLDPGGMFAIAAAAPGLFDREEMR